MLSIRGIIRGCGLRDKLMVVRLCDPLYQPPKLSAAARRRGSRCFQKSLTSSLLRTSLLPNSQSAFLEHSATYPNCLPRERGNSCFVAGDGLLSTGNGVGGEVDGTEVDGDGGMYKMSHPFSARLTPEEEFNLGLSEPRLSLFERDSRDSGQEAWLRIQDFVRFFIDVVICTNCVPSPVSVLAVGAGSPAAKTRRRRGSGRWRKEEKAKGRWTVGESGTWLERSGGGPHLSTFLKNPQVLNCCEISITYWSF
jgi:hypothetical protein